MSYGFMRTNEVATKVTGFPSNGYGNTGAYDDRAFTVTYVPAFAPSEHTEPHATVVTAAPVGHPQL